MVRWPPEAKALPGSKGKGKGKGVGKGKGIWDTFQANFVCQTVCAWYDSIFVIAMRCNVTFLYANSRVVCLFG